MSRNSKQLQEVLERAKKINRDMKETEEQLLYIIGRFKGEIPAEPKKPAQPRLRLVKAPD